MDDQVQQFLRRIATLESSNGQNTSHQPIQHGLQAGQQAIGSYGLLPNTIQETLTRMARKAPLNDQLSDLKDADQDYLRDQLTQHPELQDQIAKAIATRLLQRNKGNELAAAYSWNRGTNIVPRTITSKDLLSNDYVGKYNTQKSNESVNELAQQAALRKLASIPEDQE